MRRTFEASTAAEAVTMHQRLYNSSDVLIGRGGRREVLWRYQSVGDADLILGTSAATVPRRGTVNAAGHFTFGWIERHGRIAVDTESDSPSPITSVFLTRYPLRASWRYEAEPTVKRFVRINTHYLHAIAADPTIPALLESVTSAPADPGALFSTIRSTATQLADPLLSSPRRAALNAALTLTIIDAYLPGWSNGGSVSPTLQRAKRWMITHARSPLTNASIAAAIGISPRALEKTFQMHADTTPRSFLRRYRIRRAHVADTRKHHGGTRRRAVGASAPGSLRRTAPLDLRGAPVSDPPQPSKSDQPGEHRWTQRKEPPCRTSPMTTRERSA